MSLSPRGASAVRTGRPAKAWWVMLIGGILAWVSGQSWSVQRDAGEVFQIVMAFGTLAAMAFPAQLIAGRTGRPALLAIAGAIGITVPWFINLAVKHQGQGVLLPTIMVLIASLLLTYVVARITRAAAVRWDET